MVLLLEIWRRQILLFIYYYIKVIITCYCLLDEKSPLLTFSPTSETNKTNFVKCVNTTSVSLVFESTARFLCEEHSRGRYRRSVYIAHCLVMFLFCYRCSKLCPIQLKPCVLYTLFAHIKQLLLCVVLPCWSTMVGCRVFRVSQ